MSWRLWTSIVVASVAVVGCNLIVSFNADRHQCDAGLDASDADTVLERDGDGDRDRLLDADVDVPGEWVTLSADTFMIGSPPDETQRGADETLHEVTLLRDFELQTTEVTQEQFFKLMGTNPSLTEDALRPVTRVSWHDAAMYCNALSDLLNLQLCYDCSGDADELVCELNEDLLSPYLCGGYRLPTEAEWEYAARAGTTTATYVGDADEENVDTIAWTQANSSVAQHVATRVPNEWGLYDMLGNVWEWCHDWHESYTIATEEDPWGPTVGEERSFRGGSWSSPRTSARAASRYQYIPSHNNHAIGFRPARSAQ